MSFDALVSNLHINSYLDVLKAQSISLLGKVVIAIVVFAAGWLVIRYLKMLFNRVLRRGRVDQALVKLMSSLLTFVGWIIVISAVFKVLGFTEVSLAFSGSLALIAMGLANSASSIVGDLFSGVTLIADDDFEIGQRVTAAGITGTLEAIDMRKTRIRDDNGNLYIIPNRSIDGGTITVVKPAEEKSKSAS
ncbi:MAG: mechanosensitive ion channel family protein [Bacillota bacterium]|nr:mechanosensitive ion channel [Bacillota bacterium]HOA90351.1 mechanosensitive ion channel [Bacillota bacterium]HOJ47201.1 mechanosensitive ion channel [Bacillota bacterium]HOL13106.1 mechanosensitive ion channel [Bacillota bacterium]HPT62189.1 mechanosensitive ion channel [Bacillota bacterium]